MPNRTHASLREKRIHDLFALSVLLKGAHAIIEIVGGIALYLFSTSAIVGLLNRFAQSELIEDPKDLIAGHLLKFAEGFSVQAHHFYAFYLLSHGIVKILLVAGLLREKLWAYPTSFAVFSAFIVYQLYRFTHTHEPALIALSIVDAIVIALAWHEYKLIRRHLPTH